MAWTETSSPQVMQMRLAELTGTGVNPKSIPEMREIGTIMFHPSMMTIFGAPLMDAIEQADRMALYALAALGNQDAVLELGHFGTQTTQIAIERLKAFRQGKRLPH